MTVEPRNGLARTQPAGQLATDAPANPWAGVGLLKPHAHGLSEEPTRIDALATISAGRKVEKNGRSYPQVSRDGTIHIKDDSGRAPGLARELAKSGGKRLTIAVVSNNPSEVLQQRFAVYSTTRLLAYGNEKGVTVIHVRDVQGPDGKIVPEAVRKYYPAGSDKYNEAVEKCKVQSSFYFVLARWDEQGQPKLIFPDGLGFYRLRFTSLNSAEAIRSQLSYIASLPITQGQIAGIPLELSIDYRDVAGPDGSRRNVPVWTLVLRPPEAIELDVVQTRRILEGGIEQARGLALPMPRLETFEDAEREGPDVDLDHAVIDGDAREITPDEVRHLSGGGKTDPDWLIRMYFAGAGRTSLREDDGREAFLLAFTDGRTGSLAEFAATANRRESEGLLKALADRVGLEIAARGDDEARAQATTPPTVGRNYQELFGDDDDDAPSAPATQAQREPFTVPPEVHAAAILTGAPGPAPADGDEDLEHLAWRTETEADLRRLVAAGREKGATFDLPDNLAELDDQALETLHEALLNALEAHAATADLELVDAF